MNLIAKLFIDIFKHLQTECAKQIELVNKQYSAEPFLFTEEPLILKYVCFV